MLLPTAKVCKPMKLKLIWWLQFTFIQHLTAKYVCSALFYLICHHLLFHIFLYIFLYIVLILCLNKLQSSVWGHTKIPGGECHRHWKRDTKKCNILCMARHGKQDGDASTCAGMLVWLYCTCAKVSPAQSAEVEDSDITRGHHWHPFYVYWGWI